MSYRHIENLYRNKDILLFKRCFAAEKVHGTSAHVAYTSADNQLHFFAGGSNHTLFVSLFNKEELLKKFQENAAEHPDVKKITIYGEAYGGCFSYGTPILLANGTKKKIGEIVNSREQYEVLSYSLEKGVLEPRKVTRKFKYPSKKDEWLSIHFKKRLRGGKSTKLVVTKNHLFFVKNGGTMQEVCAEDLAPGATVFIPGRKMSYVQEQLILGSLLGDASIVNNYFKCRHSVKQKDLIDIKSKILGSLNISKETCTSGFGAKCITIRTKSNPEFKNISDLLFLEGKKGLFLNYLNKLGPIAFAFWYMDDGTLKQNNIGSHNDASELCTDGFTKEDVDLLVDFFNNRGIQCYTFLSKNKYPRLRFTPDGTVAFQSMITPYVIPAMRYKITEKLRNIPYVLDEYNFEYYNKSLIETKVDKVTTGNRSKTDTRKDRNVVYKFDLEVEGNHNYFANNILVHNSMQGMSHTYGPNLFFIAFEVLIDDTWMGVIQAHRIAERLGFEFVPYEEIDCTEEAINAARDKESEVAIRRGMGPGKMREGVVLRPLVELQHPNGGRIICKHKRPEFSERQKTPKIQDPAMDKILKEANEIAEEWVVLGRVKNILSHWPEEDIRPENTRKFLDAMLEDVLREAEGEIEVSEEAKKAIMRKAAILFKKYISDSAFQGKII